jgi:hypothetical protein
MLTSTSVRRRLAYSVIAYGTVSFGGGCSEVVIVDGDGSGAGDTVSDGPTTGAVPPSSGHCYPAGESPPSTVCFAWPQGGGGSGGAGGAPPCPDYWQAASQGLLTPEACGGAIDGPIYLDGQCCFDLAGGCCSGRPFLVADRARTAGVRTGRTGWTGARRPRVEALDPLVRASLAESWLRDALLEHASIASFSRFALELLAVGTPAALVDAAYAAARDEVRHARACFTLASAYAGAEVGPAPFGFGGAVEVSGDLAAVAASAVREGCVGETLAAVQAAEQLAAATDPAVRAALEEIVRDEEAHAELAWRFVAWAVDAGGDRVRQAVAEAFDEAVANPVAPAADVGPELAAHGRVGAEVLRATFAATIAETIRPNAALLARAPAAQVGRPSQA